MKNLIIRRMQLLIDHQFSPSATTSRAGSLDGWNVVAIKSLGVLHKHSIGDDGNYATNGFSLVE